MNKIILIVKSKILEGQADNLKTVLTDLIAHCNATEPGMLRYDWYINQEKTECIVYEVYKDSEAVLFHFNNYAPFRERLAECRSMISLEILGTPSEELKARVAKIQAPFYEFFIGK